MGRRRQLASTALVAASTLAGWEAVRRRDRAAVAADPETALLVDPEGGRELVVESPDGTTLHVEVFGPDDAPTLVLAHGWTCALRFWTRQVAALRPDVRVVAYDQRGHGRSGRAADGDYRIERFGHDLHAVLEATVPDGQKAVVAGHSLGGMTIVAWAGLHAGEVHDRVGAAALVNTGMGDLVQQSLVVRTPGALNSVKQLVGAAALSAPLPLPKGPTPISHRVVRHIALSKGATPAQVAFSEAMTVDCRPDVRAAIGHTLTRLDLHEAAHRLTVPTVVLAGDSDRLTPLPHAERLERDLPEGELQVLPGCGHMGPIERADDVSAALRRLVGRYASAPSSSASSAASSMT